MEGQQQFEENYRFWFINSRFGYLITINTFLKFERRGMDMAFIWSLIIGGIIGWLAGLVLGRDIPGGVIGNIIAGFVGAWLGSWIFGSWGPIIGDFYILPALIGAIIVVLIVSFIMKGMRRGAH